MRPGWTYRVGVTLLAPGLLIVTLAQHRTAGDEPGRFGRFFRFGTSSSNNSNATSTGNSASSPAPSDPLPAAPAVAYPVAPSSPPLSDAGAPAPSGPNVTPRIVPRPRVTRPITESDPILTRISLNRSDNGNQFGMFLQVYADGTIIDSEGVHNVGQDALRPLVEALQAGDLYRQKGHCGAPATDYLESVQVIVYERSLGRLRANAFSYSGNPQGCDNTIRHLHGTLDNLQAKIARTMPMPAGAAAGTVGANANSAPMPAPITSDPAVGQSVIPLTAPN